MIGFEVKRTGPSLEFHLVPWHVRRQADICAIDVGGKGRVGTRGEEVL